MPAGGIVDKPILDLKLAGRGTALKVGLASNGPTGAHPLLVTRLNPTTGEVFQGVAIPLEFQWVTLSRLEAMGEGDEGVGSLFLAVPRKELRAFLKELQELFKNDPP